MHQLLQMCYQKALLVLKIKANLVQKLKNHIIVKLIGTFLAFIRSYKKANHLNSFYRIEADVHFYDFLVYSVVCRYTHLQLIQTLYEYTSLNK